MGQELMTKSKIKTIGFSCYPVTDMAKAKAFYEGVLGLKPAMTLGETWQEYDIDGQTFALVGMSEQAPECFKGQKGISIAFEVEDIDATLNDLKSKNVPIVYGPNKFPTCSMFVIEDPDGNVLTMHQLNADREPGATCH